MKLETGNSNLTIRPAAEGDIPAITAIEKHAATAAHWSAAQYESLLRTPAAAASGPRRVSLVILEGESLQGFAIARAGAGEWEIENIAVAGPARKRGLGTRLLGELLTRARAEGVEAAVLEVRESNHAAHSLYEKWAFVAVGRRSNYYRDPQEDAILYRLNLL